MEMIITTVILTLLMGYAWKIYFGGRETMRNTISQSQMQTETRIFLDHLAAEIASAYRFIKVDTENKKFSFYCYHYGRITLEDMYYNSGSSTAIDKRYILVLKIEYTWNADGTIKKSQIPGHLFFLDKTKRNTDAEFTEAPATEVDSSIAKYEKVVLHNIMDFQVAAYKQEFHPNPKDGEDYITIKRIKNGATQSEAAGTTFITLRIHNKIEERADRRDEELDLVSKLYSRVQLAEALYPSYFCSTDGRFEF